MEGPALEGEFVECVHIRAVKIGLGDLVASDGYLAHLAWLEHLRGVGGIERAILQGEDADGCGGCGPADTSAFALGGKVAGGFEDVDAANAGNGQRLGGAVGREDLGCARELRGEPAQQGCGNGCSCGHESFEALEAASGNAWVGEQAIEECW